MSQQTLDSEARALYSAFNNHFSIESHGQSQETRKERGKRTPKSKLNQIQEEEEARFPKLFNIVQRIADTYKQDRFGNRLSDTWLGGKIDHKVTTLDQALSVLGRTFGIPTPSGARYGEHKQYVVPKPPHGSPWTVCDCTIETYRVNGLTLICLLAQGKGIYGTEFCESGVMSGDYLTISGVLHLHFKSLGIPSEFKVGIRRFPDGKAGVPAVWLEIEGKMIDMTYYHSAGLDPGVFNEKIFQMNQVHCYKEEDPTTTSIPLEQDQVIRTCVNNPKVFKAYATPENIGKFLWFKHGLSYAYPSYKIFLLGYLEGISMHLSSQYNIPLPDVFGKEWGSKCWHCQKSCAELMTCSVCLRARYCDQQCQMADWPLHKLLHKDLKANDEFWRQEQV